MTEDVPIADAPIPIIRFEGCEIGEMKSQPDLTINPIFFPDLKLINHSQLATNSPQYQNTHNKLHY